MIKEKQELVDYFGYDTPFSSKELYEFYNKDKRDLNKNTFRWKVYKLKSQNIISTLRRGIYILDNREPFNYYINNNMKRIFNIINREFPKLDICIWSTEWVHSMMNHQPFTSITIVEVDKDILDIAFNLLKEKFNNVYLSPNIQQIERYILDENVIVVKSILKEAPITKFEKIRVAKIEKILVDLFFESNLFQTYQGKELINIFENAYSKYNINNTTLYRYSKTRGIKDKIDDFIDNINIKKSYIGGI